MGDLWPPARLDVGYYALGHAMNQTSHHFPALSLNGRLLAPARLDVGYYALRRAMNQTSRHFPALSLNGRLLAPCAENIKLLLIVKTGYKKANFSVLRHDHFLAFLP